MACLPSASFTPQLLILLLACKSVSPSPLSLHAPHFLNGNAFIAPPALSQACRYPSSRLIGPSSPLNACGMRAGLGCPAAHSLFGSSLPKPQLSALRMSATETMTRTTEQNVKRIYFNSDPSTFAQMPESERECKLAQLFEAIDTDSSGSITAQELSQAFRILNKKMDHKSIQKSVRSAMTVMDLDRNGEIDFDEFFQAADFFLDLVEALRCDAKHKGVKFASKTCSLIKFADI